MCIVLDANCFSQYVRQTEDMKPVRRWVNKGSGKLVYAASGRYADEIQKAEGMRRLMLEYSRGGRSKQIQSEEIERERASLPEDLRSNDSHIIALGKASGARLLISLDQRLGEDWGEHITRGRVYKRKEHASLLKKTICKR